MESLGGLSAFAVSCCPKALASELTEKLRNSTSVDWQVRDSVRARMRILIRQRLRKYKYPPEGYDEAIGLVPKQAEEMSC